MGLRCCICNVTYKDKISIFGVPRDPNLRELWNRILNHPSKNLQENSHLCENHFNSSDVLKSLNINGITIPNKKSRLRPGCLPVPYLDKTDLDFEIKPDTDVEIKVEPESISTDSTDFQSTLETIDIKEEFPQFHLESTSLFESLYKSPSLMGLTDYWGIHPYDPNQGKVKPCMMFLNEPKPRSIVFSQVTLREGIPTLGKQVILNEELNLKYFVGHNTLGHLKLPKYCTNLDDLQAVINEFSKLRTCKGGPSCEEYTEVTFVTNCAYKDYSSMTWRHKFCLFFAKEGLETCLHCMSLAKYLKVTVKHSKTLKRLREELGSDVDKWKGYVPVVKKHK